MFNRLKQSRAAIVIMAILLSLIIGGVVIWASGNNPIEIYGKMLNGALGSQFAIASTIRWTTPVLFTGVAAAITFQGGMFNIGVEGQMYIGALLAGLVGYMVKGVSAPFHILLCLGAGAIGGMIWALIPAIARVYYGASEMVITLMMNYIAINLTDYLVKYHFLAGGAYGSTLVTTEIEETAKLAKLWPNLSAHTGIFIALLTVFIFWFLLNKTQLGYEIHISGLNPAFAKCGGVSVNKVRMSVMLLSGMSGGIGGAVEVIGYLYKFMSQFSPDYGFDGLAIALLGGSTPLGVLLSSIFMGIIKAGSLQVERATNISRSLSMIIQGIIITFVSCKAMKLTFQLTLKSKLHNLKFLKEKEG